MDGESNKYLLCGGKNSIISSKLYLFMIYSGCKVIGSGVAVISIAGSGVGIGILFGCFVIALSIQPAMEERLFAYVILGFALTEAIALIGVMVSMILLFG